MNKFIPGYDEKYRADTLGRIWRCNATRSLVLKRQVLTNGYESVTLYKDGVGKRCSVHRLIAMTFLDFQDNLQVNHINGVKIDNRLCNLEMCTRSMNMKHAYKLGLLRPTISTGELNGNAKRTYRDVTRIKQLLKEEKSTHLQISVVFGVSRPHISAIARGEAWVK